MTNTTKDEKSLLRADYRAKREALPPEVRQPWDERICRAVAASASFRYADVVLGYHPFGFEIDITPLLKEALALGKRLALPRTHGKGVMTFHYIDDLSGLIPSAYGIPEPREDAPLYEDTPATLCLVPGIIFDRRGLRIGYGGGYYDRFLAAEPNHPTVALCYEFQMVETLPTEEFDIPVDLVLWA